MRDADVLVVGAGIAGLRAADHLAAGGAEVVVLEARGRVGGRLENGHLDDGTPVELGGTWLGPTQDRAYALVEELGLEVFETYNHGRHLVDLGGRRSSLAPHRGAMPALNPVVLADLAQAQLRLDRLAARVPLDAPWDAPHARRLDSQTFETWIMRNAVTAGARRMLRIATEAVFSAQPSELSLLHALFYARSGTDWETLLHVDRGAQQHRVVGGTARLAEGLAQRLGERLVLHTPVRGIDWTDDGVTVTARDGRTWSARRAVIALPPTLAGRLEYGPALPGTRDQLTQRLPAGAVIKLFAVYDQPFWRDEGWTGQVISDRGPVKVTFDVSPPDGRVGILLGFAEADDGRTMHQLTSPRRREVTLARFADWFGPRAGRPAQFLERDWIAEEFTRGCYGAHLAPGAWTAYGPALRRPVGPLHWAGTETAERWNGYIDGAIRSGEDAARQVLASLP